ncbi:CoA transferase [Bacillus sp. FJAT-50079]|uniref:CaiB/BaiF CoA transferase family protein n=1 Tax=Bacillus sp. FJAT-50079 TaxID=2833577 RepID=UPI001BC92C1E|nr:CoA transferase [Bacillus sp. FJAT-50079]MBS4207534.1 CoA transferase [Bacillus sp. FJAT-50079]
MLKGIKVLNFTHFLQGPSSVQMLADLGADVIKIEQTKGAYERYWSGLDAYKNGVSVFFLLANRNQKSLALDLRSEEGKEIIYQLVKEADIVVENYRPGAMERLGLGYEHLKELNPKIIYCSCSGYGSTGPYYKRPGQDLLLQSMSGLMSLSGRKNDPPTPVGTAVVDQHGAVLAAFGVVTALFNRERTGEGMKVESNLLNAALDLQIESLAYHLNKGELWERSNSGLATRFHQAPYGVYQTRDGYITVSNTPVEKLSQILHSEELAKFTSADQMSKRDQIDGVFSSIMKERSTDEWIEFFVENDIWFAPVNDYHAVINDEQVKHNEMIITLEHPIAGEVRLVNHPVKYNGKAPEHRLHPPLLGEYSREILQYLGYSDIEIDRLIEREITVSNEREAKSIG